MISRILVPLNARITESARQAPTAIERAHLVPRRLIPANAKLTVTQETQSASAGNNPPKLMVRKLLVPPGARIGETVAPATPDGQPPQPGSLSSQHHLFDEALLTKAALGHRRTAAEWAISFAVHAAIIGALVIVPLYFTQTINPQQLELTYLVAPPMPVAPAPPPPPAAALAPRPVPKHIAPVTAKLTMPLTIPKAIPKPQENNLAQAPPDLVAGIPGGVPGGIPGGVVGGVLGGIVGGTPGGTGLAAPPSPPPVAAAPSGPLQVGGQVKAPHLLSAPMPDYPVLAREARIQGNVEIDAIIDEHGNVVKEHAISGSGVLIPAALEAVSQWKYEPTYLNGKPYPVELAVDVTFRL